MPSRCTAKDMLRDIVVWDEVMETEVGLTVNGNFAPVLLLAQWQGLLVIR